jgi:ubiquinone/menaquinone biosynthesis C-methylase UbiE
MSYTSFDRFVAWLRFRAAQPHIRPQTQVCDIGCGLEAAFLGRLRGHIRYGVGLDYQVAVGREPGTPFVLANITQSLPVQSEQFDHAVMLAVFEHLRQPEQVLREINRILRPGGSLVLTWPSAAIDPLLDVLHRVRIVSDEMESGEHQPRISVPDLIAMLRRAGFVRFEHRRFEFGLNNLMVAHKGDS